MKLQRRRMSAVILAVGSVLAVSSGNVSANCSFPIFVGSFSHYIFTPGVCPGGAPCPGGTSVTDDFSGSFWALGHGDPRTGHGVDSGAWPAREGTAPEETGWVRSSPGQAAYLAGWWGMDLRVDDCIATNCVAVVLSDEGLGSNVGQGHFSLLTSHGDATAGYLFESDVLLAPIPMPLITSSSRHDGIVEMTMRVDAPTSGVVLDAACAQDVLRGYKIYTKRQEAIHVPPSDLRRSSWTVANGGEGPGGAPLPFGSQTTITVDPICSGWNYYFAASLVFEGGFETAHLSRPRIASDSIPEWPDRDCDGVQPYTPDGMDVLDCDDNDAAVYPGAPQICDHKNNDCDDPSWPSLAGTNEDGADLDADSWTGACDNCPIDPSPSQADSNANGVGDACDTHDGLILLRFADRSLVAWQEEAGFDSWNLYRGSLDVLHASGVYTQAPGSNPIARRDCGIGLPSLGDGDTPPSGKVAFYLVTGTATGAESDLGANSEGQPRPNSSPCQ